MSLNIPTIGSGFIDESSKQTTSTSENYQTQILLGIEIDETNKTRILFLCTTIPVTCNTYSIAQGFSSRTTDLNRIDGRSQLAAKFSGCLSVLSP